MRAALLSTLMAGATAHFNSVYPPAWTDAGGKFGIGSGCSAGCTGKADPSDPLPEENCNCMWYTNYTFIGVGAPTIPRDSPLRTYQDKLDNGLPYPGDLTKMHPWRAPGTAAINSPCGAAGGNPDGCPPGNPSKALGVCGLGGYAHGPDARDYEFRDVVKTEWKAGSVVEAAWAISANHGGGYSHRLCPKPAGGNKDLTEDCFRKLVLRGAGDKHWIQYGKDAAGRTEIPAVRTTKYTSPEGSEWTRNPIPACLGPAGGANDVCTGPQFPPPKTPFQPNGVYGFGNDIGGGGGAVAGFPANLSVVDKVQVPADLAPGDYVLSTRFDCEQTTQVWFSCADIRVAAA